MPSMVYSCTYTQQEKEAEEEEEEIDSSFFACHYLERYNACQSICAILLVYYAWAEHPMRR
jgi:hypothetical protein